MRYTKLDYVLDWSNNCGGIWIIISYYVQLVLRCIFSCNLEPWYLQQPGLKYYIAQDQSCAMPIHTAVCRPTYDLLPVFRTGYPSTDRQSSRRTTDEVSAYWLIRKFFFFKIKTLFTKQIRHTWSCYTTTHTEQRKLTQTTHHGSV